MPIVLAVVLVLACTPIARADSCAYLLVSVDIIWEGGFTFYFVPNYELFCSIDTFGSGGGPGGGGPGGGPGGGGPGDGGYQQPPPTLELSAVSDQDPKNYAARLILANTDVLKVFVNGNLVNSYYGSPASVLLGSLDNVPSGSNEIAFQAENSVATITRSFTVLRSPQNYYGSSTVNVGYQYILGDPSSANLDTYTRILTVNALYTAYSTVTEGPRNGRVEHETVTDEMDFVFTTWFSRPSVLNWTSTYSMTDVDFSDAMSLAACGAFSHCGSVRRFAIEGHPNGFRPDGRGRLDRGRRRARHRYPSRYRRISRSIAEVSEQCASQSSSSS